MRSTLRQRLPSLRRFGALALLWAAPSLLPALFPAKAGAVQIYIESAFVHRKNEACVATSNGHGVVRFRCPPIPDTTECDSASVSCDQPCAENVSTTVNIVSNTNDRLTYSIGSSFNTATSTLTAVVPAGTYAIGFDQDDEGSLCAAIRDALEDAEPAADWRVKFNFTNGAGTLGAISITRIGGNWNLIVTGSFTSNSIGPTIGLNSNQQSRTTYTSDTPFAVVNGGGVCGNALPSTGPCENPSVGSDACNGTVPNAAGFGNISNDPEIQFDRQEDANACAATFQTYDPGRAPFPTGTLFTNFCNADVYLCASIGYGTGDTTADTAIDEVSFEVFKFQDGSNPLDPASTPPQRTFFIDAPGVLPPNTTSDESGPLGPFCALWDGEVNIQGKFGKTNGQFGFRAHTVTNQTGASGNIQITATRAYPSGATYDADPSCAGLAGCLVSQKPITVDVTNIHVVRSSPSLAGTITPVPTEPYNIFYRLSKDATMFITINGVDNAGVGSPIRSVLNGVTRVGEGVPNGSLSNGDSWNGRSDNGNFTPPGNYLAVMQAVTLDQFGTDLSHPATFQIGLDPLQITDIRVQPLLEGSTSLAVIDYVLTEPATTYIDIYPPGTQFCKFSAFNVNDDTLDDATAGAPPKNFQPSAGGCSALGIALAPVAPVKRIVEQKPSRTRVVSFWDGRDPAGHIVDDGDYVFVIYAALPSQNGFAFNGNNNDRRIWTSQAKSGFMSVIRGFVQISQVTPASSVIGSSPSVAGLNPFLFRYSLSRDAIVNMKIFDSTGLRVVKTLVTNEQRPGLFGNIERWDDGTDDNGLMVDSGTYIVQLTATDPLAPAKVSTTTALFPIHMFRVVDTFATPLLSGASDVLTVSYQLSQPMNVWLNIYPPGTVIKNVATNWPPCAPTFPSPVCADIQTPSGSPIAPVVSIRGLRAGRLRITEQWDGRDSNGLLVPDGQYVFVIAARSTSTPVHFPTDRSWGTVTVQRGAILFPTFTVLPDVPTLFNSSNTITLHPFTIQYAVTRQSSVTIQILTTNVPQQIVRNVVSGGVRESGLLLSDIWDGRDERGNFPPAGFYIVRAVANDLASQLSSPSTAQVTISYDPIRIYDVAVSPVQLATRKSSIFYQVSEPMKVSVKIFRPGTTFDNAGNPNPPENLSLVKRLVGVKPARTEIEDIWDGTDLRLSLVPDGSYKFKIVGSTDVRAIDDLTGNVLNPSSLSLDRPLDEIPVVRGASKHPERDFENNSFVFPNPISGNQATFQIYVPFQGRVILRLYNIAGELVLEKDFGEQAPSFSSTGSLEYVWTRSNQSGRGVARGIYYAVIRAEETIGGKSILQTVKKVLVQ